MPHESLGFPALHRFGVELMAGLRRLPRTVELIAPVRAAHDALVAGQAVIEKCLVVALEARADLRFDEIELEADLKRFAQVLEVEDRGGGHLLASVFPDGVQHVVAARSAKQVERAEQVLQRALHPSLKGAESVREVWARTLRARIDSFSKALEARETAVSALKVARQEARILRRAFVVDIDRVAGQLRALFPKDRGSREAVWPRLPRRARRVEADDGIDEESVDESSETFE